MFDAAFLLRVLVSALLTVSGLSWLRWGLRPEQFGGPPATPPGDLPQTLPEPVSVPEPLEPIRWPLLAVFAMLFWVGTMIVSQIAEDTAPLWRSVKVAPTADEATTSEKNPPRELSDDALWASMVMGCIVFVGLGLLLFGSGSLRPDRLGITTENWPDQILWGQQAFTAAILPTFVLLVATMWFRTREAEHPFLRAIRDTPDQVPLLMMFFTAAIVAPLSEELVFRVTLQGWLADIWHPRGAIITTAVIFSFVHGWRDGIALLPLSLILGYLYHVRRSFLAVVIAHGLFNATNMALAVLGALSSSS